ALRRRRARVGGISHRHRLHDDRGAAADLDAADFHADRAVKLRNGHEILMLTCSEIHQLANAPTLQLQMKAIVVRAFGGPDVLRLEDAPALAPAPAEVLVRVRAAGVNPADTYIRAGTYAAKPPLPYTP